MSDALQDRDIEPETSLATLCAYVEEAMESLAEPNRLAQRDADYYHNHQYTAEEREVFRKRKQPCIVDNIIKGKVDIMCGLERKARVDPSALPRTQEDEDNADAATHALRYVKDDNDYDVTRSAVYKDMLLLGVGGIEIVAEPDHQGKQRVINRWVPWDRLIYDPHSRFNDFADAKYLGVVVWMDYEDALDMWPDAGGVLEATIGSANDGLIYEDRPHWMVWADAKRRRVRFVQLNYREDGEWMFATFTKGGFLDKPDVSPYIDREGASCPQFILRSAFVDSRNARYGYVRSMIDMQDEVNKRRSKMLHLLNTKQIVYTRGAIADVDKARAELAKPDGAIEINPIGPEGKFEINDTTDMSEGQFKLLEYSIARMQTMGPNASMSGDDPRDLSGKAIIAQQTGGAIEIEPIADELRQFDRRVFEANWMRIRQFWDSERWIRVTKDGNETQWVGLNRSITLAEALAEIPDDQRAQAMQQMQPPLQPGDPRLKQVIGKINDVQDLDVDITVDDTPEFPTLQAQQFEIMVQLVQAGLPIPPKAIIMMSQLRDKNDIMKMIDDAQQQQAQQQQAVQQLGQAKAVADIQETQARTQDLKAKASNSSANAMDTQIEALWKIHRAREAQSHAFAAEQAVGVLNQAGNASHALVAQGTGR